jgi:beta-phosphoglucomutase-like phosphatase (HAD superfamily)
MDGTVVDSEHLWAQAMTQIAAELGGTLSAEVLARTTGLSVPASVDLMLTELGSDLAHHEATEQLLARTAEVFAAERMWQPGAQELIDAMRGLRRPAAQCLAVEDSPSGTAAAVAAGIPVLVVPSEVDVPEGPGRVFAASLLDATVDELRHLHHAFHRSRFGA